MTKRNWMELSREHKRIPLQALRVILKHHIEMVMSISLKLILDWEVLLIMTKVKQLSLLLVMELRLHIQHLMVLLVHLHNKIIILGLQIVLPLLDMLRLVLIKLIKFGKLILMAYLHGEMMLTLLIHLKMLFQVVQMFLL